MEAKLASCEMCMLFVSAMAFLGNVSCTCKEIQVKQFQVASFLVAKPTCLSTMGQLNKNSDPSMKGTSVMGKEAGQDVLIKAAEMHLAMVSFLQYMD